MSRKATEADKLYSKWYRKEFKDKEKQRHRKYYLANTSKEKTLARRTYDRYKKEWDRILTPIYIELGFIKCNNCGAEKFQFHHDNPANKKFAISQYVGMRRKPTKERVQAVVEELHKCSPLCLKCHLEWHYHNDRKIDDMGRFI